MGKVVSIFNGQPVPEVPAVAAAKTKERKRKNGMGLSLTGLLEDMSGLEKRRAWGDFFFLLQNPDIASQLGVLMDGIRQWLFDIAYLAEIPPEVEAVLQPLRFRGIAEFAVPMLRTSEADWENDKPHVAAAFLEYRERIEGINNLGA